MTNLAKLRCFKELVKKLGGQYTEDADSMYYDCSGGEGTSNSNATTNFFLKDDGTVSTAFSVSYITRKEINAIGYVNCTGYSKLNV